MEKGKIDTETDFGVYNKGSFDDSNQSEDENGLVFIPRKINNRTVILIDFKNNNSDSESESNEMAKAVLNSAKYKLTISKTYMRQIKKVSLENDDLIRKIPFYDLNDEFLIEIHIATLLNDRNELILE